MFCDIAIFGMLLFPTTTAIKPQILLSTPMELMHGASETQGGTIRDLKRYRYSMGEPRKELDPPHW